jgi:hypothetical protein
MSKNVQITGQPLTPLDKSVLHEEIESAIKDTLAMLADVDRRYDLRREAIKKSSITLVQKKRLRAEVDSLHRKDRQPLVLRLADFHYRMMRASLFKTMH